MELQRLTERELDKIANMAVLGESMKDYHYKGRVERILSSHKLINFMNNEVLFQLDEEREIDREPSGSMITGSMVHKYILEGETEFLKEYTIGGLINPKTGKEYGLDTDKQREYCASIGKQILSEELYTDIKHMSRNLRDHNVAGELISIGFPESVIRAEINGMACQIRPDWLGVCGMFDLKTCENLDYFHYDIKKWGYDIGSSFYNYVINEATGVEIPTFIVAVERLVSHRVGVWEVPSYLIEQCKNKINNAIEDLTIARNTGIYKSKFTELKTL